MGPAAHAQSGNTAGRAGGHWRSGSEPRAGHTPAALPLLATQDSVPEIALKLRVWVNIVRKQVVSLRAEFGAESRAELVRKASAYGTIH